MEINSQTGTTTALFPGMSAQTFSALIVNPLTAWMFTASMALVIYLILEQIRDFRKNRRMQARRRQLGLHHA